MDLKPITFSGRLLLGLQAVTTLILIAWTGVCVWGFAWGFSVALSGDPEGLGWMILALVGIFIGIVTAWVTIAIAEEAKI